MKTRDVGPTIEVLTNPTGDREPRDDGLLRKDSSESKLLLTNPDILHNQSGHWNARQNQEGRKKLILPPLK